MLFMQFQVFFSFAHLWFLKIEKKPELSNRTAVKKSISSLREMRRKIGSKKIKLWKQLLGMFCDANYHIRKLGQPKAKRDST